MFKYDIYNASIMCHHALVLCGVFSGLYTGKGGIEMIYGYFCTEFANPCLHMKESLRVTGQKDSGSFLYAEILFIVTFFFSRFGLGIPTVYYILLSEQVIIYERLVALFLELLFVYWGYNMIGILQKRYAQYHQRKTKGEILPWFIPLKKND